MAKRERKREINNTVAFVEYLLLEKHGVLISRIHILWGWAFFYLEGGSIKWKSHWKEKYKYTFCVCMFLFLFCFCLFFKNWPHFKCI